MIARIRKRLPAFLGGPPDGEPRAWTLETAKARADEWLAARTEAARRRREADEALSLKIELENNTTPANLLRVAALEDEVRRRFRAERRARELADGMWKDMAEAAGALDGDDLGELVRHVEERGG